MSRAKWRATTLSGSGSAPVPAMSMRCRIRRATWRISSNSYCDDRFWCDVGPSPNTRYLASGRTLIVIGDAQSKYFLDNERGVLAQFRHQHFLLFLIAHFQRAALLMFADRLAEALKRLDIGTDRFGAALQAQRAAELRDFSALHASLLVSRSVGTIAGAVAVRAHRCAT